MGDRNFHIFYQLLCGSDIHLLKCLKLQRNIEHYRILQIEGYQSTQSDDEDRKLFIYTKSALTSLGFSDANIVDIFRVLAIILKLGNLQFVPCNNIDGTDGSVVSNEYELFEICELLGAEPRWLQRALTSRLYEDGIIMDLNTSEASKSRDILCRTLYSRLFTWLINDINDVLKARTFSKKRVLGVMDLFGFEYLQINQFEQLIINYCNEKIQQYIVHTILKEEQEDIMREGLEWTRIDFFNNAIICQLLENENHGILSLLEEQKIQSDDSYLTRMEQCCAGHSHYIIGDPTLPPNIFQIKHYAGTVNYTVQDFTEKNRDLLPRELSRTLFRCDHPLMQSLFPEGNPKRCNLKKPLSKAVLLRISLNSLLKSLPSRQMHYIRCLKPNELKLPRKFEDALIQHQVRYLNLIATVQVCRNGFCFKLSYPQFLYRYKMVSAHTWPKWRGSSIEGVSILLRSLPIPIAEFTYGRTKLFVRSPRTVYELEDFRRSRLHDLALLIQKCWRGFKEYRRFRKMIAAQKVIASAWKNWKMMQQVIKIKYKKEQDWAATIIQRHYIQWKRRQYLLILCNFLNPESESPLHREWPPCIPRLIECDNLLKQIHHRWRCCKFRLKFNQIARNRMREKVTASFIFKDRKCSYPRSVSHPFLGDYVRLRQNIQWKKMCSESHDQYVVFADIINKIARTSGKFVPILLVISTSSMLILDQRTLQIKYRVPASDIYKISLSPYMDDVAVVHIKTHSDHEASGNSPGDTTGCLFQNDGSQKKGDFVIQTGHVIEIVTKLFLVVQNATGRSPEVNISTIFEANFGSQIVTFTFKCVGLPEVLPGQIKVLRKSNKMEILV